MKEGRRIEEPDVERDCAASNAGPVDFRLAAGDAGATMPIRTQHVDGKADYCRHQTAC